MKQEIRAAMDCATARLDLWRTRKYGSIEAQQAMENYMNRLGKTFSAASKKAAETRRKRKAA